MTISYVGAGVFGSGTTSAVSAYPSGGASDLILALIGNKPYTSTPTNADHTQVNTVTSGSVANTNGGGSVRATAFTRNVTTTAAGTTDSFAVTSGSPTTAQGLRFATTLGSWLVDAVGLSDTDETGTTVSATGTASSGQIASGDWVVVHAVIKDEAPNHTSQTLTVAGCTVGTITWLSKGTTTSGNDGGVYVGYAQITAGSSTGTCTYAATSSVSGAASTAVNLVRIREQTPQPPVANFTASTTTPAAGDIVAFTDTSTNTPTSWSWDFGDGTSSTLKNPYKAYQTAGTYTVSLTATNAAGSDGETKTNYVTVSSGTVAVTHVATSTIVAGTTTVDAVVPTGFAPGNLLIMAVGAKPDTVTFPTISGWTKQVDQAVGSGTAGVGTGPSRIGVYTRTADGSEGATVTVTPSGTSNVVEAGIGAWSYGAGSGWSLDTAYGSDTTSDTSFSATADHVLGETAGDTMWFTLVGTADTNFGSVNVAATGATYGTTTERTDVGSSNGNALRLNIADRPITAGTATAASVATSTASSATVGGAGFVRLRPTSGGSYTGTPSDPVGVTDAASQVADSARTPSDAVGVTDSPSRVADTVRAPADAVGVTDAVAVEVSRAVADPVGVTDAVSPVTGADRTVSDPVGVSGAASAVSSASRTPSDSVGVTDSVSADLNQGSTEYTGTPSDPVGISDTVAAAANVARTVTDPVGVTDSPAVVVAGDRSAVDAVGVTDALAAVANAARTRADAVGVTDTVTLAVDRNPADSVGVTDGLTGSVEASRSLPDPVGVTDSVSAVLQSAGVANPSDPVGVTDQATAAQTGTRTPADPVGVSDAVVAELHRVVTVADFLALTDTAAADKTLAVTDPVGVTDETAATSDTARPAADPVTVTDAVTAVLDTVHTVADLLAVTDSVSAQLVDTTNFRDLDLTLRVHPDPYSVNVAADRYLARVESSRYQLETVEVG